jgi:hypothetical protein
MTIIPHFDSNVSRQRWDRQLKKFGDRGALRQSGMPDRPVTVSVINYNAIERMGGISNPVDRKALVSVLDPDTSLPLDPEPSEKDVLVTFVVGQDGQPVLDMNGNSMVDELLKIVAPPARVGTSRTVLFWRIQVRA